MSESWWFFRRERYPVDVDCLPGCSRSKVNRSQHFFLFLLPRYKFIVLKVILSLTSSSANQRRGSMEILICDLLQSNKSLILCLGKPSRIDIPLEDGMKAIGDRSPYIINYKVGAIPATKKIM